MEKVRWKKSFGEKCNTATGDWIKRGLMIIEKNIKKSLRLVKSPPG
jgi:hypothetical protein